MKQNGMILHVHGKKKESIRASVITPNLYFQINTGILEKVIAKTSGHR